MPEGTDTLSPQPTITGQTTTAEKPAIGGTTDTSIRPFKFEAPEALIA